MGINHNQGTENMVRKFKNPHQHKPVVDAAFALIIGATVGAIAYSLVKDSLGVRRYFVAKKN